MIYSLKYYQYITFSLVGLALFSGAFLLSSYSYATDDNAIDNVSVNVPVSCTMSGTGMNSHNANIVNGTYQADIGSTTLKAFCNDTNGFAIYATGYTGNTIGETNSNKLVGASSNQTIVTGTATSSGNPDVSNWAMKLATNSNATYAITLDNSFNAYHAVPNEYTKVAHRDSGTDIGTGATGAELTTTYAAYISKTQAADTYSGQVIYTLVHPSSEEPAQPHTTQAGKICYYANASTAEGQMGCQSISASATSATLWASNFKRDGYGFAGWSDAYDYATNSNANFYGPNETISFTAGDYTGSNPGLSLYAVWIKSAGTIQNWDGCSSLAQGATTALTDERDSNTYAVAKLADNKCWTIENLRLADKDSSNNDINLSSTNTHNPSLPLTNIYDSSTTSNHLSPTSSVAYNVSTAPEGWCTTDSSACDNQSRLRTDNTMLFTNNTALNYSASSNVYSYGNYYNWYSATAGHGKYGSSYGTSFTAPGDICPAGWHLPTGKDATEEFSALDVAMGGTGAYQSTAEASNRWRSYPNNFVYSGNVSGASVNYRNSYGYYWSASGNGSGYAFSLYFYSTDVSPGAYNGSEHYGRMVRCVAGV